MRKVKRMIPLVACCCLLATLNASCGCSNLFRDPEGELFAYLAEKYPDDKFTKIRDAGGGIEFQYDYGMYVKSEKFPDAKIHVSHGKFGLEAEQSIRDNYMAYYFEEEAKEYTQQLAEGIYGECVCTSSLNFMAMLSPSVTLESTVLDYLQNSMNSFSCSIYLPMYTNERDRDEQFNRLCDLIVEQQLEVGFYIGYLSEESYHSLTETGEIDIDAILDDTLFQISEDRTGIKIIVEFGGV